MKLIDKDVVLKTLQKHRDSEVSDGTVGIGIKAGYDSAMIVISNFVPEIDISRDLLETEKYQIFKKISFEYLIEDVNDSIEDFENRYYEEDKSSALINYLYDNAENIATDISNDKEYGSVNINKKYFLDTYIMKYMKKFVEEWDAKNS